MNDSSKKLRRRPLNRGCAKPHFFRSRIRFTVPSTTGTVTINRTTFATVAHAIEAGKVKVIRQDSFDDPNTGAEYRPDAVAGAPSGRLLVPQILGRVQEGEVMHECTHAFFDLTKSPIRAAEEEAVCYVVNALYFRMTGLTPTRWHNEPHKTAKSVADALLHQYAVGVSGIPAVNASAWGDLLRAVMRNPRYLSGPAGFLSQVPGPILPRWFPDSYTHDG